VKEKVNGRGANGAGMSAEHAAENSVGDEILEKDTTEERLERLLFGDDAGFLEGLKARSADQQLTRRTGLGGEDVEEAEGAEVEVLDTIADDNVRISPVLEKVNMLTSSLCSSSSLILV